MARLGIMDYFSVKDSEDLVIVGKLAGTLHQGDAVLVRNPGDDDDEVQESLVVSMEVNKGVPGTEATNQFLAVRLKDGRSLGIKKASVLFTEGEEDQDIRNTYLTALGDEFILKQDLELSDDDLMAMSITDCAETGRLFRWYQSKRRSQEEGKEQDENAYRDKMGRLAKALCKKLLDADEVFCIYAKSTGEPYMNSHTVKKGEGYLCSPPNIRLFTKAFEPVMRDAFKDDRFEIRCIENGSGKDGIKKFLQDTFYLNGACGVEMLSEQMALPASLFVEAPKDEEYPTNPDFVRFMLLFGQLGEKDLSENDEICKKLYFRFLAKEMEKSTFLIPAKKDEKTGKLALAVLNGKFGRPAVKMYSDKNKLQAAHGKDCQIINKTIADMIGEMDCAVNVSPNPQYVQSGCYISKELYDQLDEIKA